MRETRATKKTRPAIDIHAALMRFGGSLDFYLELLDEFVASLPSRIAAIRDATAADAAAPALAAAHGIKGAALTLEAKDLGRVAGEVELAAEEGRLEVVAEGIDALRAEADRVADWLRRARPAPVGGAAR